MKTEPLPATLVKRKKPIINSSATKARLGGIKKSLAESQDNLKLSKSEKSTLNLSDNAKTVAASLKKLQAKLPADKYDSLESEFTAISQRLKQVSLTGDKSGAALESAQLNVLMRQSAFLLDPSDQNQGQLDDALRTHADALIADVNSKKLPSQDLATALVERVQSLTADKSATKDQTAAVLRAINLLAKRTWDEDGILQPTNDGVDPAVKTAAQQAADRLAGLHQEQMSKAAPSDAPREAPRTPSEVLVHLQALLAKALESDAENATLKTLITNTRKMYMKHTMTVDETRKFLTDAATECTQAKLSNLAELCNTLLDSLPEKNADMPATRLHDNIYGRVFDTKFIADLVANPPAEVKSSMQVSGRAIADLMDNDNKDDVRPQTKFAGNKIKEYLSTKDPRFWLPKVPGLEKVRDAKSTDEAFTELKNFLRSDMTNGQDCVAMPYVLCKLSLYLKAIGGAPWMFDANDNYEKVIMKQAGREAPMAPEDQKLATDGAGITLRHQPAAVAEDWMVPSQRPATVNRPKIGGDDMAGRNKPTDDRTSDAIQQALAHGAPYASGASGSTNIMLHLLKYLNDKGSAIDTKNYLLGTMMFLVYDGGHSMHEVLWTANQLNTKLGLNLDLGAVSTNPADFVADYEKFAALFTGNTGTAVQAAMDSAWKDTGKYFGAHSVYAGTGKPQTASVATTASVSI